MKVIETNRLVLRSFIEGDWKDIKDYFSDESVFSFDNTWKNDEESCKKYAKKFSFDEKFIAIVLKDEKKVIGHLYFAWDDWIKDKNSYEIGYLINPKYQRRGFAKEAVRALIDSTVEDLKIIRYFAICISNNIASNKLLESLNFKKIRFTKNAVSFKKDSDGNDIYLDENEYEYIVK